MTPTDKIKMVKIGTYYIPLHALSYSLYDSDSWFSSKRTRTMHIYDHGVHTCTIYNKDADEVIEFLKDHYERIGSLNKPIL